MDQGNEAIFTYGTWPGYINKGKPIPNICRINADIASAEIPNYGIFKIVTGDYFLVAIPRPKAAPGGPGGPGAHLASASARVGPAWRPAAP